MLLLMLVLLACCARASAETVCPPTDAPTDEVTHVRGISISQACSIQRAYVRANNPVNTMWTCVPVANATFGRPKLLRHSFDHFRLTLSEDGVRFKCGRISFVASGQNIIYCG
jgi:hypothetical protein